MILLKFSGILQKNWFYFNIIYMLAKEVSTFYSLAFSIILP